MEIKSAYPKPAKRSKFLRFFRLICGIIFALGAISCAIVNLSVGGKAWSIVAVWSIYIAYTLLFTPLIEYNLIGEGLMLTVRISLLLLFIDVFLASGWASLVIPIVISSSFSILYVIFLSDIKARKSSMMPFILALFISCIVSGIFIFKNGGVPMIVLCSVSSVLFIASIAIMGSHFILELKKYFHVR